MGEDIPRLSGLLIDAAEFESICLPRKQVNIQPQVNDHDCIALRRRSGAQLGGLRLSLSWNIQNISDQDFFTYRVCVGPSVPPLPQRLNRQDDGQRPQT